MKAGLRSSKNSVPWRMGVKENGKENIKKTQPKNPHVSQETRYHLV